MAPLCLLALHIAPLVFAAPKGHNSWALASKETKEIAAAAAVQAARVLFEML